MIITLVALFLAGLSIPDAGDIPESMGSALTVLMGDKSGDGAMAVTGTIFGWSLFVVFVGAVGTFIAAFLERARHASGSARLNPDN
jgi:hypothetical protein